MRVAIIHYWLIGMRGGEKVVEALCRLYPQADIFTHVYVPDGVSATIRSHKVTTSFIARLPAAARLYKTYLPLMPLALEQLDLRGYDLIISSESGPSKGIIPSPNALHICYCHSPMRYIWNMAHDYRERAGFIKRALMPPLSHYLRLWDASAAQRVDDFVANSQNVARRVRAYYRRESTVIYPPVDVQAFDRNPAAEVGDFYLMVGELVGYKRPDLAVDAFNSCGRKLVIVGGGEMLTELRNRAKSNVTVLGPQPLPVLRDLYGRCKALIFPGEEDFGIVPVEAMASGRPVVAFRAGGATETIVDGLTGILFDEQTPAALLDACLRCEQAVFDSRVIAAHAEQFSIEQFASKFTAFVNMKLAERAVVADERPSLRDALAS